MGRKPNYFAIIPATVRYDEHIPANAKLLYGEISALSDRDGVCQESDCVLAEPYGMTDRTVRGLIKALVERGYLLRFDETDRDTGAVTGRVLILADKMSAEMLRFLQATPGKSFPGGVENLFQAFIRNSNIYNPPKPPQGGDGDKPKRKRGYREQASCLPERFEKFWEYYRTHVPATSTAGNKQKALRAWDNLAPTDELATTMAKALAVQVKSKQWKDGIGVQHASTWINNHGWEDELGVMPDPSEPAQAEQRESDPLCL